MILERKKIAGQNSKAKATGLNQKDRIQELVGSPSLNKHPERERLVTTATTDSRETD